MSEKNTSENKQIKKENINPKEQFSSLKNFFELKIEEGEFKSKKEVVDFLDKLNIILGDSKDKFKKDLNAVEDHLKKFPNLSSERQIRQKVSLIKESLDKIEKKYRRLNKEQKNLQVKDNEDIKNVDKKDKKNSDFLAKQITKKIKSLKDENNLTKKIEKDYIDLLSNKDNEDFSDNGLGFIRLLEKEIEKTKTKNNKKTKGLSDDLDFSKVEIKNESKKEEKNKENFLEKQKKAVENIKKDILKKPIHQEKLKKLEEEKSVDDFVKSFDLDKLDGNYLDSENKDQTIKKDEQKSEDKKNVQEDLRQEGVENKKIEKKHPLDEILENYNKIRSGEIKDKNIQIDVLRKILSSIEAYTNQVKKLASTGIRSEDDFSKIKDSLSDEDRKNFISLFNNLSGFESFFKELELNLKNLDKNKKELQKELKILEKSNKESIFSKMKNIFKKETPEEKAEVEKDNQEKNKSLAGTVANVGFKGATSVLGVKFLTDTAGWLVGKTSRKFFNKDLGWGDIDEFLKKELQKDKVKADLKETFDFLVLDLQEFVKMNLERKKRDSKEFTEEESETRQRLQEEMKNMREKILTSPDLSEEEKTRFKKVLSEILRQNHEKNDNEEKKRKENVGKAIDAFVYNKVSKATIMKDLLNSVLMATGQFALRGATYALSASAERALKADREFKQKNVFEQNKALEKTGFIIKDMFINSTIETVRSLAGQGAKESSKSKKADFVKAVGKIFTGLGIYGVALGDTDLEGAFDKFTENLEENGAWDAVSDNFTNNIERLQNLPGKIAEVTKNSWNNLTESVVETPVEQGGVTVGTSEKMFTDPVGKDTVLAPEESVDTIKAEEISEMPVEIETPKETILDTYEIKKGEGLFNAINNFEKNDEIKNQIIGALVKEKGLDIDELSAGAKEKLFRDWKYEEVSQEGYGISGDKEHFTQVLHEGAKTEVVIDENGHPDVRVIKDENVTELSSARYRDIVKEEVLPKENVAGKVMESVEAKSVEEVLADTEKLKLKASSLQQEIQKLINSDKVTTAEARALSDMYQHIDKDINKYRFGDFDEADISDQNAIKMETADGVKFADSEQFKEVMSENYTQNLENEKNFNKLEKIIKELKDGENKSSSAVDLSTDKAIRSDFSSKLDLEHLVEIKGGNSAEILKNTKNILKDLVEDGDKKAGNILDEIKKIENSSSKNTDLLISKLRRTIRDAENHLTSKGFTNEDLQNIDSEKIELENEKEFLEAKKRPSDLAKEYEEDSENFEDKKYENIVVAKNIKDLAQEQSRVLARKNEIGAYIGNTFDKEYQGVFNKAMSNVEEDLDKLKNIVEKNPTLGLDNYKGRLKDLNTTLSRIAKEKIPTNANNQIKLLWDIDRTIKSDIKIIDNNLNIISQDENFEEVKKLLNKNNKLFEDRSRDILGSSKLSEELQNQKLRNFQNASELETKDIGKMKTNQEGLKQELSDYRIDREAAKSSGIARGLDDSKVFEKQNIPDYDNKLGDSSAEDTPVSRNIGQTYSGEAEGIGEIPRKEIDNLGTIEKKGVEVEDLQNTLNEIKKPSQAGGENLGLRGLDKSSQMEAEDIGEMKTNQEGLKQELSDYRIDREAAKSSGIARGLDDSKVFEKQNIPDYDNKLGDTGKENIATSKNFTQTYSGEAEGIGELETKNEVFDQELPLKEVEYYNLDKLGIDETKSAVSDFISSNEKIKYVAKTVSSDIENQFSKNSDNIKNILEEVAKKKDNFNLDNVKNEDLIIKKDFLNKTAPELLTPSTNETNIQIINGLLQETDINNPLYEKLENMKTALMYKKYAEKIVDDPIASDFLKKAAKKIISGE